MSAQVSSDGCADLRAWIADPAPSAARRNRRITARTIRLVVAAADAAQMVAMALAARAFFPGVATAFSVAETVHLAALTALLAAPLRYALHTACASDPEPRASAALRAVAAVAITIVQTGAVGWLVLSRSEVLPDDILGWFIAWLLASSASAAALRFGSAHLAEALIGGQRVVVVGVPEDAEPLARSVVEARRKHWHVGGRLDDSEAGSLDRLVDIIERRGADIVALAMTGPDAAARIAAVCERIADQPVRVCRVLDAASLARVPHGATCIGPFVLVDLFTDPQGGLDGAVKRATDVVMSGFLLLAFAPALALVALAIRLESPGPVLFRQWRFGLGNRPIFVLKFRTMRIEGCDATGERRTVARDSRVTRVGRFLRRTSIDELPQLINVLRGEMSLVGPRPHPLHMRVGDSYYFDAVSRYRVRHLVKPGITGWAQINGSRGEVDTLEKARRRVELDLWYLQNWSLVLDFRILLSTALGRFGTWHAD
jgi:exopolysaccharide biosynthesis polyprenyl glycosylphosphotransferase